MGKTGKEAEIERQLRDLSGPRWEDAWHTLVELGPIIQPRVYQFYETTANPIVRRLLINILAEFRGPEALRFLHRTLRDDDESVWKESLDAIVSIGGRGAARVLTEAKAEAAGEKWEWIEEALNQVDMEASKN